jgi:hypothetical protein
MGTSSSGMGSGAGVARAGVDVPARREDGGRVEMGLVEGGLAAVAVVVALEGGLAVELDAVASARGGQQDLMIE